jgi:hypothetical protein
MLWAVESSIMNANRVLKKKLGLKNVFHDDFVNPSEKLKKIFDSMNFDVILGNPPYSKKVGPSKTEPIWDKFVEQSFNLVKDSGYISMVHPSGWRDITGRFGSIKELLKSKELVYLEIHNTDDGKKTFGVTSRYDWYVVKNSNTTVNLTKIKFESGTKELVDINKLEFIPNDKFNNILSLLAKDNEETVDLTNSHSAYEHRKIWMQKECDSTYKYPCVQNINVNNIPSCFWYSNTNKKGHFGIPKVMFGRLGTGVYFDKDGEYGCSEDISFIVDTPENLGGIYKALQTNKFIELMNLCNFGGLSGSIYNRKIISLFRKDFWKDFI